MGHAILYCAGCNSQLREPDFEKGAAFRVEGRAFCLKCAPEGVRLDPPPPKSDPIPSSSSRIPKVPPASTRKMAAVPVEGGGKLLLFGGAGVAAVCIVAVLAMTGGDSPRTAADPPTPPVAHGNDPVPPPPPPPPPPVGNEKSAEEAIRKARDYAQSNPANFAGQLSLYETAIREAEGTGHHATALRERDAILGKQKEQVKIQLDGIDASVRACVEREEFAAATKILNDAKARPVGGTWATELDNRATAVGSTAEQLYGAIKKDAMDASKRGATEDVKKLVARVDKWGIHAYRADLAKAVTASVPKPPPKPVPPKELDTYRKQWTEAIAIAAGRDWPAAIKKLEESGAGFTDAAAKSESAADLALFKAAMAAQEEGLQILSKTAKGQKLTIAYLNPAGTLVESAGTVARVDAGTIDLTLDKGNALILVGEIAGRSVAQSMKGKRDGRELALLCLAEGDVDGAKTFVDGASTIPDKYWKLAPPAIAAEAEARRLFYAAERDLAFPVKAVGAAQKLAALLSDKADTAFVRRNRALIAVRAEPPKEFFLAFEDLRIGGGLKSFRGEKEEMYWKAMADGQGFADLSFSAVADVEYRCWVYAGGCCLETIACTFQIAEGGDALTEAAPARQLPVMTHKTHAAHEGRGRPVPRWGWAQIPLPKFSAAGPKRVRILSPSKGFCVAQAFVTALRTAPPPMSEIRDLERMREARPDPSLVGHWKLSETAGTAAPDSSPLGVEGKLVNGGVWTPGTSSPWSPPSLKLEGKAYVDLGTNLAMLQNASGYTMATWINADKLPVGGDQYKVFSLSKFNGTTPTGDSRASLSLHSGGVIWAGGRSTDGGTLQGVKTTQAAVKAGAWVHVAGVIDLAAGTVAIYINGVPHAVTGTVAFASKCLPNTPSTCGAIGSEENEAKFNFQGRIANLRVYNRALSKEEIAELAAPGR